MSGFWGLVWLIFIVLLAVMFAQVILGAVFYAIALVIGGIAWVGQQIIKVFKGEK